MSDFEKKLSKDLSQGKEYREAYAQAFSNEYLATQIKMLRRKLGLTQAQLGERIGSNQGRMSVYEDEDYGKWSQDTLWKLASEFDLWVKTSFEPYAGLVHEAAHFEPQQLVRPGFDEDQDIQHWLETDAPTGREKTRRAIQRWAVSPSPDVAMFVDWLQGLKLPEFDVRQFTPVQAILEAVPASDTATWNAISRTLAYLLGSQQDDIRPLVRDMSIYRENLFGLASAIGAIRPRPEIQDALEVVYRRAAARFQAESQTGLGYEGEAGLVDAMVRNQVDDRWRAIWNGYLDGGDNPGNFSADGHPFLPGGMEMGIRGLLGLPQGQHYWRELARGVRDLEQRFLLHGRAQVTSEPNVMDALVSAVDVIFDWWGEPAAARKLIAGSVDLMGSGSWSMNAGAAWAYCIYRRPGWAAVVAMVTTHETRADIEHATLNNAFASGLMWYWDWERARNRNRKELDSVWQRSNLASIAIKDEVYQELA